MKILNACIWQECNYKCANCPMVKWLYPRDHELNALRFDTLTKWLTKYINPKEWFIVLTGGEPSLFPEFDKLLNWLRERDYIGSILSNGNKFNKITNFKVISAWHKDMPMPETYDEIVVVRDPEDSWSAKVDELTIKDIKYRTKEFVKFGPDGGQSSSWKFEDEDASKFIFDGVSSIYASGTGAGCWVESAKEQIVLDMKPPIIYDEFNNAACPCCNNICQAELTVEKHFPDLFSKLMAERTELLKSKIISWHLDRDIG